MRVANEIFSFNCICSGASTFDECNYITCFILIINLTTTKILNSLRSNYLQRANVGLLPTKCLLKYFSMIILNQMKMFCTCLEGNAMKTIPKNISAISSVYCSIIDKMFLKIFFCYHPTTINLNVSHVYGKYLSQNNFHKYWYGIVWILTRCWDNIGKLFDKIFNCYRRTTD